MDMAVAFPAHPVPGYYETSAREYASLADHRRQVFALIGEFRQAVARPRGARDAVRILREMLPYTDAYFTVVESLLDKISAAGAAPHRDQHRLILEGLKSTLERCSASDRDAANAELVHALDMFVMHEATICLRGSGPRSSSR